MSLPERAESGRPAASFFLLKHLFPLCFAVCLAATAAPLWAGRYLPSVDWPQHLFLINLMDELKTDDFAFRDLFTEAPGWTYLVFYYSVHLLARALPLETAFTVFVTLVLAAIPLSLLFLARSLGRSRWLVLLTFPMLFTYAFYWGLFSFMASLPWTFLAVACFVRILGPGGGAEPEGFEWKSRRGVLLFAGSAVSLALVQLTHAASMVFPALALPLMLALTPSNASRRKAACLSAVPGAALFLIWLLSSMTSGHAPERGTGQWQARGGLLEAKTYVFQPLLKRLKDIPSTLAGGFWSYADRPALYLWLGAIVLVIVLALINRQETGSSWRARLRPWALALLAAGLYFGLPTDVTGYMYMIHPRYAQVAALLLAVALPFPRGKMFRVYAAAATALCVYAGVNLTVLFHRYDAEAREFEAVLAHIPQGSRIMHLVTSPRSGVAVGATYLHYAALAAERTRGIPSFSLARHDPFPVHYSEKGRREVPIPQWEWRPNRYDWRKEAAWYDVYLLRGPSPEAAFGRDVKRVEVIASSGLWRLYRKKAVQEPARRPREGRGEGRGGGR